MGKTVALIVGVVAAVAIAIAAPYLAPLALGALGITATATAIAIATAVIAIGLSLAVSFAFKALGVGSVPSAKAQVGPPQVFRQSITDAFIVYGLRRLGGLLAFYHAKVVGSDHYRYYVIACAGHRCHALINWLLNDDTVTVDGSNKVTSGPYANNAWVWFQRGLANETANATFVAECDGNWTTDHRGDGICAVYLKFKMTDAVVQAGMPNMTELVEGRDEILDPRDGSIDYSRNAALIFYDWMAMPREEGGFGAYDDEIPLASWISAQANVSDETVNGNPRYAFDAYLTTGAAPSEVRDSFVVNCAGSYSYVQGKHLMRPGYWNPVIATLSEKDLAGPIQVTPFLPSDTAATQVQGTYISPADGYQGMPFTTWNKPGAADVTQLDLDLAHTTVKDQADRVAAIMGKRAACEKQVVWPMNIVGLCVAAMDTVQLNTSRFGLSNYAWVVGNWSLTVGDSWGAVITGREENPEIYDDAAPVSPSSPSTIVQPTGPLLTTVDAQALINNSGISGLTFSVGIPSGGNSAVTISAHSRVYSDKTVSVNGNSGPVNVPAASGDLLLAFYDDPDRAGGAVTYQYLVVAGGAGDASSAFASPANPYRHNVFAFIVPTSGGSTGGGSDAGSGGGSGGSGGGWNRLSRI